VGRPPASAAPAPQEASRSLLRDVVYTLDTAAAAASSARPPHAAPPVTVVQRGSGLPNGNLVASSSSAGAAASRQRAEETERDQLLKAHNRRMAELDGACANTRSEEARDDDENER
jgi:hypothetical protein